MPRELAAELAPEIDAGRAWSAVVLREQRPSPREPRTGVTMLLARGRDRRARGALSYWRLSDSPVAGNVRSARQAAIPIAR